MRKSYSLLTAVPMIAAATLLASPSVQADSYDRDQSAVHSAQDRINDATSTVDQMKQDSHLRHLLDRASGVFIVPHYGRAAFIVGGQGGGGVLVARHHGTWSDPAFYSIGGGSVGLQAGASGGSIAMILMTPRAVRKFENSDNTWSLNADAGLTVVTYSGRAQADTGNGDVIVWSNTKGLYGGINAGVTDVTPDVKMDHAYYHGDVSVREIIDGRVANAHAMPLRDALQTRVAQR